MKKLIAATLLALCVSISTLAGDIPFPPEPPPPPCRQDCETGALSITLEIWFEIVEAVTMIVSTR